MILVIDGNNLAFVVNSTGWTTTKNDFPNHAINGFLRSLRSYVKIFNPRQIFVAWDGGRSKKRKELLPEYKANRDGEKTPEQNLAFDAFREQVPVIQETLLLLGVHQLYGPGVEGDDLVAMMAMTASNKKEKCVICSNDADFLQLVGESTSVYSTVNTKKRPRHITVSNIEDVFGLKAEQMLDYKCLLGDSSDNIPGVRGVGKKTATSFLKKYGSIEEFLHSKAGPKTPKREMSVLDNQELLEKNRQLMDLSTFPDRDFKSVRIISPCVDDNALKSKFIEFELNKLRNEFMPFIADFSELDSRKEE